jgi:predicted RNase H-like nuclease (RuvC/YqgF family)
MNDYRLEQESKRSINSIESAIDNLISEIERPEKEVDELKNENVSLQDEIDILTEKLSS